MEYISSIVFNLAAYFIGVCILKIFTLGKFKGESSYARGCAIALGTMVLSLPFLTLVGWLLYLSYQ